MSLFVKSLREMCRRSLPSHNAVNVLLLNVNIFQNVRRVNRSHLSLINRLRSTLGQSFVLVQDGIEITELPWVVKRLGPSEFTFNGNVSIENAPYAANDLRSHDFHDVEFSRMLQECTNVKQVIQLLEVPGESVTSQSAAFALHRINMLRNSGVSEDINSFIRKAILNELCDTVVKDIKLLPHQTIISLVMCCTNVNRYESSFIESVNEEVERRISLSMFTVEDLCQIITTMSENVYCDANLLKMCWIHLGMKTKDINEKNIVSVFQVLRNMTPEFRYLLRMADKQLQTCWWKLVADDVASICKNLCLLNYYSSKILSSFGRWMFANVHTLNDDSMKHVLGMYLHFNYSDPNVVTSLEKFVSAFSRRTVRGKHPPNTNHVLMSMAADFCLQKKLVSSTILNSIATDFALTYKTSYDIRDGLTVLKTFGQLGYSPNGSSAFFMAAELWTESNLPKIKLNDLLELLASFVYIERFPVNFIDRVLNARIPILFQEFSDSIVRQKASKHLLEIQSSHLLEFPSKKYLPIVEKEALKISLTWMDGRTYRFHKEVALLLKEMLNSDTFYQCYVPINTPHLINFQLLLEKRRLLKESPANAKLADTRLALLLMMPEYYCSNGTMMGEHVMKKRHLELLGYTVILIQYELFSWKNRSLLEKTVYLKSLLEPYINLKS